LGFVCATLTGLPPSASGPLGARRFALALVDEATQAVEARNSRRRVTHKKLRGCCEFPVICEI